MKAMRVAIVAGACLTVGCSSPQPDRGFSLRGYWHVVGEDTEVIASADSMIVWGRKDILDRGWDPVKANARAAAQLTEYNLSHRSDPPWFTYSIQHCCGWTWLPTDSVLVLTAKDGEVWMHKSEGKKDSIIGLATIDAAIRVTAWGEKSIVLLWNKREFFLVRDRYEPGSLEELMVTGKLGAVGYERSRTELPEAKTAADSAAILAKYLIK